MRCPVAELLADADDRRVDWLIVPGGEMVGQIAMSNIVRGALESANVGYSVDGSRNGRGIATNALGLAVKEAFGRWASTGSRLEPLSTTSRPSASFGRTASFTSGRRATTCASPGFGGITGSLRSRERTLFPKCETVGTAAKAVAEKRLKDFPNLDVRTKEEDKDVVSSQINFLRLFYVLLAMAVIIAIFGIVLTLALSVFQRAREIGLLRAVGLSRRSVRAMIRWEWRSE